MPDRPPKLTRHADHDPALICRPAFGYGLCEPIWPRDEDESESAGER